MDSPLPANSPQELVSEPPQGPQIPAEPPVPPNRGNNLTKIGYFIAGLLLLVIVVTSGFIISQLIIARERANISAQKPTIKLAVNPWKASELNATIAKIILEEEMGYIVELVAIDENSQWEALARGDIHASLEIWPSGHKANIEKYIQMQQNVDNIGFLGPIGKIGWFVPKYLVDEYPQLATWEGFLDPTNVVLFADSEEGKGQFYTGDVSWTQYDEQIIKNLNLNFEVNILGSEEALIQKVESAYKDKSPIVFYFWTPHWAHSIFDLIPVVLPEYSDDCYTDLSGGVACDYPADQLFKATWSEFSDFAPEANQFLKAFRFTNQDQIGMLAAVQLEKKSVEEVARIWVRNNEAIWRPWLK